MRCVAAAVVVCAVSGRADARAASIEGVHFEERLELDGLEFRLNAVGLLRYMRFFKAYAAALYLGPGCEPEEILNDHPKRLEISYFHPIVAGDFAEATRSGLERNVPGASLRTLESRIEQLVSLYRDVEPGDRYALTYVPGRGTELSLNGVPLGVVEGADFASAVFAIWFGEPGVDRSLKQQLLAGG